jgi:hypothetical protein
MFRALAIAGVLALVLAGCGDDGGGDDATDDPTTTEADETTTEAPDATDEPGATEPDDETSTEPETTTTVAGGLGEDEAQAIPDQIDLTLEEVQSFNPTFEVQELDDEDEQLIDGCIGDAADIEPLAEGDGVQYDAPQAYTATTTAVMTSEDDAIAYVSAFEGDDIVGCLEQAMTDLIGEDGVIADLSGFPGGTRFGDQWANVGGLISGPGASAAVELHVLRTGPIVTFLFYLDLDGGETTAYTTDGLLTLIDERQAAAVG